MPHKLKRSGCNVPVVLPKKKTQIKGTGRKSVIEKRKPQRLPVKCEKRYVTTCLTCKIEKELINVLELSEIKVDDGGKSFSAVSICIDLNKLRLVRKKVRIFDETYVYITEIWGYYILVILTVRGRDAVDGLVDYLTFDAVWKDCPWKSSQLIRRRKR